MNYRTYVIIIVLLSSCGTQKVVTTTNNEEIIQEDDSLKFDCYYSSDTLENLIAYFPEEKIFYLNDKVVSKEDVCQEIEYALRMNKGVKHYYHPQSNFFFMISIQQKIEKCYRDRIDQISIDKYSKNYEGLDSLQKLSVDKILKYKMLSK